MSVKQVWRGIGAYIISIISIPAQLVTFPFKTFLNQDLFQFLAQVHQKFLNSRCSEPGWRIEEGHKGAAMHNFNGPDLAVKNTLLAKYTILDETQSHNCIKLQRTGCEVWLCAWVRKGGGGEGREGDGCRLYLFCFVFWKASQSLTVLEKLKFYSVLRHGFAQNARVRN